MKRFISLVAAFLYLCAGPAHAQPVTPAEFAYGIPIDTVDHHPVQVLVVPQAVYEHLVLPDLGDVRVFNAAGVPVPHAVYGSVEPPEAEPARHALPVFPVYGRAEEALGNLDVQVQRRPSGALIQIGERPGPDEAVLRAYLVDASGVEAPVGGLVFDWADPPENLLVRVTVETSEDLIDWQPWGAAGTLASMRHDGQALLRNTLDLPARRARYYRISWPAGVDFPALDGLEALTAPARPEAERYWTTVPMTAVDEGVFTAEISPGIPFDRVAVDVPGDRRILRIRLTSSADPDGPEIQHFRGLAYRFDAGDDAWTPPPVAVTPRGHRYWRVTLQEGDALLPGEAPSLRIGWVPARLLFVPQGEGPFTLAYGNADAEPAAFRPEELLAPVRHTYPDVAAIPPARAGDPVELGGPARLERRREVPWQQVALWGSLLAGVALLGWLAVRLLREAGSG